MKNKDIYGNFSWWINVSQYYQVGENFNGRRWRLSYDDDFIADFDHMPTMEECMKELTSWWNADI